MQAIWKFGRRAGRIPLVLGVAFGCATLAASAAQAGPVPVPWNVNYHDFGSASGSFAFVFTNLGTTPMTGVPAPFQHAEFQVIKNTCGMNVAPGGSCKVRVSRPPTACECSSPPVA